MLLVKVEIEDGGKPGLFPPDNRIGALLLYLFLLDRLAMSGVEVGPRNGALGPLNKVRLCFNVSALQPALDVVFKALEDASLLPVSKIGFFDAREGIFRGAWPDSDCMEILTDEWAAEWTIICKTLGLLGRDDVAEALDAALAALGTDPATS
jgi:hypothetical protein